MVWIFIKTHDVLDMMLDVMLDVMLDMMRHTICIFMNIHIISQ